MNKRQTNLQIIDRTPAMRDYFRWMDAAIAATKASIKSDSDERSRDELITENLRLAVYVASQYKNCGLEMEELIGYANIGLVEAADHYDATRGVIFASYACHWCRKEVIQGLTDCGHPIRLPMRQRMLVTKMKRVQGEFFAKEGREATAEELAEMLAIDTDEVVSLLLCTERFKSLDEPLSTGEDGETVGDTIADADVAADEAETKATVEKVMQGLGTREREILERLYLKGEDFRTIGRAMHLTPTRVRQIYRSVCPKF